MKTLIVAVILCMASVVIAQNDQYRDQLGSPTQVEMDTISAIQLKGEYRGGKMWLRWGMTNPYDWALLTLEGVVVERYEVDQGGLPLIDTKIEKVVTPWSFEEFATYEQDTTSNMLVMRQALYGMDFTKLADLPAFGSVAEDLMDYHSFAHLVAEYDFDVAVAGGLGYVDDAVSPSGNYFYKVRPVSRISDMQRGLLTMSAVEEPIPAAYITNAFEREQHIMLQWDRAYHELHFSGYWIERRTKGNAFVRLNEQPFVGGYTDDFKGIYFSFVDSIDNYQPHDYRIVGITSFSRLSAPSTAVTLSARDNTPCDPIRKVDIKTDPKTKAAVLSWEAVVCPDLEGYHVSRASSLDEPFTTLTSVPIGVSEWRDVVPDINQKNYYRVSTIDTAGNAMTTMSFLAVFRDTLPPAPPVGLVGTVDTSGAVSLTWSKNKEQDLAGYHIYRANSRTHAFALLNASPHRQNSFTDSIAMNTLTESIFYRFTAVDYYGHVSAFSDIIELKRPDLIPPFPPTITDYEQTDDGVHIRWQPSLTKDVVSQSLYRRSAEVDWVELKSLSPEVAEYTDATVDLDVKYAYRLISIDDAGLPSTDHSTIHLKVVDKSLPNPPNNLICESSDSTQVRLIIDVSYTDSSKGIIVYRSVNDGPMTVLSRLGKETVYLDNTLRKGSKYSYAVKHVWQDNKKSPFSQSCATGIE